MSTDLRVGFKERHHKRLHEAIDVVLLPAKRAFQEEPEKEVPPMPVPLSDTAGLSSTPATEKEADPTSGGASNGADVDEVLDQKDTPAFAPPPSWDEMMEMLKWVLCFTDAEPPSIKMSDFFPLTKRISVNLGRKPPVFVSAWLPFGTPESAISCI